MCFHELYVRSSGVPVEVGSKFGFEFCIVLFFPITFEPFCIFCCSARQDDAMRLALSVFPLSYSLQHILFTIGSGSCCTRPLRKEWTVLKLWTSTLWTYQTFPGTRFFIQIFSRPVPSRPVLNLAVRVTHIVVLEKVWPEKHVGLQRAWKRSVSSGRFQKSCRILHWRHRKRPDECNFVF